MRQLPGIQRLHWRSAGETQQAHQIHMIRNPRRIHATSQKVVRRRSQGIMRAVTRVPAREKTLVHYISRAHMLRPVDSILGAVVGLGFRDIQYDGVMLDARVGVEALGS